MASEDLGRDLISVNNLIKKHAVCQSVCCFSFCLSVCLLSTFLCVCLSFLSVCLSVCLSVSPSDHILQFHEDTKVFLLPIIHITTTCTILTPHTASPAHHVCTTHIHLLFISLHLPVYFALPLPTHPLLHLLSVHSHHLLQLLENDIQAQQGRIDDIMAQVRRFREANHFQSDQIEDRGRELVAK